MITETVLNVSQEMFHVFAKPCSCTPANACESPEWPLPLSSEEVRSRSSPEDNGKVRSRSSAIWF